VSGVDERETGLGREAPLGHDPIPADGATAVPRTSEPTADVDGDAGTGWPTTPAEIPLDGPIASPTDERARGAASPAMATTDVQPRPQRHSRNPVDRLTRGLPDPIRVVVDWVVTIVGAVAIVLLVKAFVVNPYRIPSSSMEPTLHCAKPASGCEARLSDRVLANRFIYHFRDPRRGEIIVFNTPDAARIKCGAGGTFVKRLIGLPGETVEVRLKQGEGYVFINGKQLREPYIKPDRRPTEAFGPVKVQPGHYFMMGDNRSQSCDSREWGTVPRGNLIGEVFATYWPPNRISLH
jgi:signal peptidase I